MHADRKKHASALAEAGLLRTHHSEGTTESVSVYTKMSKVQGSSSSGRKVTDAVI